MAEYLLYEAHLTNNVALGQPSHMPFADHVHGLVPIHGLVPSDRHSASF
jgi:hypothetical protein